jgi:hypothetical protein
MLVILSSEQIELKMPVLNVDKQVGSVSLKFYCTIVVLYCRLLMMEYLL